MLGDAVIPEEEIHACALESLLAYANGEGPIGDCIARALARRAVNFALSRLLLLLLMRARVEQLRAMEQPC